MSQGPASTYAALSRDVAEIARRYQVGNDPSSALVLIARAAFVQMAALKGHNFAAEKAFDLESEFTGGIR